MKTTHTLTEADEVELTLIKKANVRLILVKDKTTDAVPFLINLGELKEAIRLIDIKDI